MVIYGTALLSACLLIGIVFGRLLGALVGVNKDVGGVGIAMLLLIVLTDRLQKAGFMPPPTKQGILFWSSIYIPIVVAMAASQNVVAGVKGGPLAILAGTGAVVVCFALVPLISRMAKSELPTEESAPLAAEEDGE
jgi:malonate transporter MadL subunit